jgi:hypothetical protein
MYRLALLLPLAALGGCSSMPLESMLQGGGPSVKGSGVTKSEHRSIRPFERIKAGQAFEIDLRVGSAPSLRIEGDDNLLRLIRAEVRDGTLHISSTEGYNSKSTIRMQITTPRLEAVSLSGATRADVRGIDARRFKIDLSGASRLKLEGSARDLDIDMDGAGAVEYRGVRANRLNLDLTGAGNAQLSGTADRITVQSDGAGRLDGRDLRVNDATVRASGAGNVTLNVRESLKADASGAATVRYYGSPSRVEAKESGAANIKRG